MKKMAEIRFGFVFFVLFSLLISCGENDKSLVDMASSLSVESVAELPRCSKIFEGKTADVDEGGSSYVCRNGKWIQAATNYKTEKDMPECTKKREGSVAFIEEAGVLKTCINEKWKLSSEIEALSSGTDDKDGVSSSVNNTGSSASSVSSSSFIWDEDEGDTRQVRFEAGVLWKPGYGQRVRTFNSEADEYTFFNDKTTNDWWRTSSDMDNSGQSMALFKVGSDYATISTDLVYGNWKKGPDGLNVASSSVYAAAGFNWAAKGYADISEEKGVCFVYTSGKDFRVELVSKGDPWDYWNAWVPASSKKKPQI